MPSPFTPRRTALVALLVLAAALAFTSGGRSLVSSVLDRIATAASGPGERYRIRVVLGHATGRPFEWEAAVSRSDADEAEFAPRKVRDRYVEQARRALAVRLGYNQPAFGDDASKLVSSSVMKVEITDARSSRVIDLTGPGV